MPDASEGIKHSEAELMRLVSSANPAAERMIYLRYVRGLTAVCARYILNDEDIKDVLQESFIRIFASIRDFEFRGEGSLRAWLTRVVVNESLKFLRVHRKIEFIRISDELTDLPDEDLTELSAVPDNVIFDMIRQLPDGYRMIFNLYVIEGKTHKEIAQMLNIKENTSASQLHRAKAMLAGKIRNYQNH